MYWRWPKTTINTCHLYNTVELVTQSAPWPTTPPRDIPHYRTSLTPLVFPGQPFGRSTTVAILYTDRAPPPWLAPSSDLLCPCKAQKWVAHATRVPTAPPGTTFRHHRRRDRCYRHYFCWATHPCWAAEVGLQSQPKWLSTWQANWANPIPSFHCAARFFKT